MTRHFARPKSRPTETVVPRIAALQSGPENEADRAAGVAETAGQPLSARERAFFEPRFGSRENRAASEWLGQQAIRVGDDVGEAFIQVNRFLDDLGALKLGGGG